MQDRPARPLIFEPTTRWGVIDTHWKWIGVAALISYIVPLLSKMSFLIVFLAPPAAAVIGITASIHLRRNHPPNWLEHKALSLFSRVAAFIFRRPVSLRRALPGVDPHPAAQPEPQPAGRSELFEPRARAHVSPETWFSEPVAHTPPELWQLVYAESSQELSC